ncbi:ethanolamine ammonia-lyase subunit EutB [Klebsiella pneumoniae]|nr:ethanolamine ammonia-lyase subunit EutB [Klebsiella pneumoniae]
MYKTTLSGEVWRFDGLKTLMAASPARSGDALAGLSPPQPKSGWRQWLAEVPLTDILNRPLIPYGQDEVTRPDPRHP